MFKEFLKNGFQKITLEQKALGIIYQEIFSRLKNESLIAEDISSIHKKLDVKDLNNRRLSLINHISGFPEIHNLIYDLAQNELDKLLGPDIAVQKKINISIQMPHDQSSLLDLHTDVLAGNSPYEIILWFPLCDVEKTASFYLLPLDESKKYNQVGFVESKKEIFEKEKDKFYWPNLKFGEGIIFSPMLVHGNVENLENYSRISLNIRFKSLFTPFHKKKLGEYFIPLKEGVVSKVVREVDFD